MIDFFSNLFNRNIDPKSIISFDVIDSIYSYLYNENSSLELKIEGIKEAVNVNLFYFPGSFDDEKVQTGIKKAGFNNSYEVLNELYKKIDIGPISQENMEAGLEYDFIHIQFYSAPSKEMKQYFKHVLNNFVIFFCSTNSLETNNFRMLYSSIHFTDYTQGLLGMEYLDLNNPKNETQEIGIKDLKLVLQGICEYLNIEIPEDVELPSSESLLQKEVVTATTFEELIKLVSRGDVDEKLLSKQSKKLFKNFQKDPSEYHHKVEGHYEFFESVNAWNSDWKFDPEDAEYFISEMIGQDLNFNYPEETYSHDLFPYIQTALEKHNLELLSYETYGDSYLFFVANKEDVGRILKLSELTKIEIVQL